MKQVHILNNGRLDSLKKDKNKEHLGILMTKKIYLH